MKYYFKNELEAYERLGVRNGVIEITLSLVDPETGLLGKGFSCDMYRAL